MLPLLTVVERVLRSGKLIFFLPRWFYLLISSVFLKVQLILFYVQIIEDNVEVIKHFVFSEE